MTQSERSERTKARYYRLKAARKCQACQAGLLPEEPYTRCTECLERAAARKRRRKVRAREIKRVRTRYHNNEEFRTKKLQDTKARRLRKKLAGECYDCPAPSLADSSFCKVHRKQRRAQSRQWWNEVGNPKRLASHAQQGAT